MSFIAKLKGLSQNNPRVESKPIQILKKERVDNDYYGSSVDVLCLCEDGYARRFYYSCDMDELGSRPNEIPPLVFWDESLSAYTIGTNNPLYIVPPFAIGDCVYWQHEDWRVLRYVSKTHVEIELRDSPVQIIETVKVQDLQRCNKPKAS